MPVHPALRQARREAERLRGIAQLHTGLAAWWCVLAPLQWITGDQRWLQVTWTVLAVGNTVLAVLHRRKARDAAARAAELEAARP